MSKVRSVMAVTRTGASKTHLRRNVRYWVDNTFALCHSARMDKSMTRHIISAERVGDAVLIEFDDRKCAMYPAALLYDILPQAIALRNAEPEHRLRGL
jgi:hypothetical protein